MLIIFIADIFMYKGVENEDKTVSNHYNAVSPIRAVFCSTGRSRRSIGCKVILGGFLEPFNLNG